MPLRTLALLIVLSAALPTALAAATPKAGEEPPLGPSKDQGRAGTYQATTKYAGCNYYVCVPKSYSAEHPAGLHLFFHGQNGQGGAPDFGRWGRLYLEPYNLIGINMQYTDGDNMKDTDGKVAAAQQAIAQVCADYKVIVPRGVVSSFSGGGLPHGLMAMKYAGTRGPHWPFALSAMYSSNYNHDAAVGVPMAWYIGVGTEEWTLAGLGASAVGRASEIYRASARGGDPDLRFLVTAKGHTITDRDVESAAALFPLADLAFCPFVYVPDYADKELKELRPVVEQANAMQPGAASATLAKLLARPTLAAPVKAAAERLQATVTARLDAVAAMVRTLAADDPVRAQYYGPLLLAQLKGGAAEKEARAALAAGAGGAAKALAAYGEFVKLFPGVFGEGGSSPKPVADKLKALEPLAPLMGERAQAGTVAAMLLSLGGK
jgi:hypothetical protein